MLYTKGVAYERCGMGNSVPATHAAQALGRGATHGQLQAGYVADFIVWDAHHPVEMVYEPGRNPLYQRIFRGEGV